MACFLKVIAVTCDGALENRAIYKVHSTTFKITHTYNLKDK